MSSIPSETAVASRPFILSSSRSLLHPPDIPAPEPSASAEATSRFPSPPPDTVLKNDTDEKTEDEEQSQAEILGVFLIENPEGLIDAVAGLENLPVREDVQEEQPPPPSRLQCHHCNHMLEYDLRAHFVQCGNCNTLNAARQNDIRGGRVMIVICGRCHTRNIAALGSIYVECWLCHTVCQVDYPSDGLRGNRPNGVSLTNRRRNGNEGADGALSSGTSSSVTSNPSSYLTRPFFRLLGINRPPPIDNYPDSSNGAVGAGSARDSSDGNHNQSSTNTIPTDSNANTNGSNPTTSGFNANTSGFNANTSGANANTSGSNANTSGSNANTSGSNPTTQAFSSPLADSTSVDSRTNTATGTSGSSGAASANDNDQGYTSSSGSSSAAEQNNNSSSSRVATSRIPPALSSPIMPTSSDRETVGPNITDSLQASEDGNANRTYAERDQWQSSSRSARERRSQQPNHADIHGSQRYSSVVTKVFGVFRIKKGQRSRSPHTDIEVTQ